ncbi:MAG: hypothetical protein IPJ66_12240 [Bacteroidetes bacterium]|nr:hypothetical protein [Bacteroidota bacterium]MBL0139641.1 hypothetical protein [Bacteroidota bacterium]
MQHLHVKKSNSFAKSYPQKPIKKMKKVFSLLLAAGMVALISCGPSAEEKAAAEKARQDSISAAMEKIAADSIAAVQAAAEQARQDSINAAMQKAQQDSIDAAAKKAANKPKPKAKPKAEVKAPEGAPKVGMKKPGAK